MSKNINQLSVDELQEMIKEAVHEAFDEYQNDQETSSGE
jgi:hypothetical protein